MSAVISSKMSGLQPLKFVSGHGFILCRTHALSHCHPERHRAPRREVKSKDPDDAYRDFGVLGSSTETFAAPGFHTISPLHEKQRDTRRCQAVTKFNRRSGFPERSFGFVTACKRRVSRFWPFLQERPFQDSFKLKPSLPRDMPSRTEAHAKAAARSHPLRCAGEGSAPLLHVVHRFVSGQDPKPLPLGRNDPKSPSLCHLKRRQRELRD
jgi:hypothetical protein